MNITRHNYEEYFLLYIDNELSAQDRKGVEAFVQANPDLGEELTMFRQSVLHPDKKEVFTNKELLLKNPSFVNPVNESNYEEYFVLYGDDELTNEENDYVEVFVYKNPQYQQEFELIQKARLTPDTLVAFPDKSRLYREEKTRRVIVMRWWGIAAAAVVLLFAGALGWNLLVSGPGKQKSKPPLARSEANKGVNKKGDTNANRSTTAPRGNDLAQTNTPDKKSTVTQAKAKVKKTDVPVNSANSQQDVADSKEKQLKPGNYSKVSTVTPQRYIAVNVPNPDEKANTIALKTTTPIVDRAIGFEKENLDNNDGGLKTYAVNDNNQTQVLNTSVNNKNKLRGFFRKVTRVVGRTTNLGSDDNENNKGLRIANFEIALK